MADILHFPSKRTITKAEPCRDSAHVHLLASCLDPARNRDPDGAGAEKRARFARVFGARDFGNIRASGANAHGVRTGCAMRRGAVSHEAWLCWFHLVHFLLSFGGMVASLLARPRAANLRTIGAGANPRQTMHHSELSTEKNGESS